MRTTSVKYSTAVSYDARPSSSVPTRAARDQMFYGLPPPSFLRPLRQSHSSPSLSSHPSRWRPCTCYHGRIRELVVIGRSWLTSSAVRSCGVVRPAWSCVGGWTDVARVVFSDVAAFVVLARPGARVGGRMTLAAWCVRPLPCSFGRCRVRTVSSPYPRPCTSLVRHPLPNLPPCVDFASAADPHSSTTRYKSVLE